MYVCICTTEHKTISVNNKIILFIIFNKFFLPLRHHHHLHHLLPSILFTVEVPSSYKWIINWSTLTSPHTCNKWQPVELFVFRVLMLLMEKLRATLLPRRRIARKFSSVVCWMQENKKSTSEFFSIFGCDGWMIRF